MIVLPAVEVRDAVKSYDKGKVILNHMNMTVPRGTIYVLLGSSGCGKSSILTCIVGLRRLDSGTIRVFGQQVPGNGIPGRRLGYMPQDVALYPHFTIQEILLYFGRIYGMTKSDILKREEFLAKFLQLPDTSKRISSLSGGQQRRVSLATSFVHDPELLILDEPTVGLDPLLRNSIWDYLCQMVNNGHTTVIVTTHYTEEIRRSGTIGLMRNGRLLAENSPNNLLQAFNASLLDDIVLELCRRDHNENKTKYIHKVLEKRSSNLSIGSTKTVFNLYSRHGKQDSSVTKKSPTFLIPYYRPNKITKNDVYNGGDGSVAQSQNCQCVVVAIKNYKSHEHPTIIPDARQQPYVVSTVPPSSELTPITESDLPSPISSSSHLQRINSLIRRNCIFFMRNILFFILLMVYPATQTALVAVAIGGDPKNMSIAVINDELPDWREVCRTELLQEGPCYAGRYSCRFLSRLENDNLNLVSFPTRESALEATHSGKLYGLLQIPTNYTQHVIDRNLAAKFALNETLGGTTIRVGLDFSNYVASLLITRQLYKSLESYAIQLGRDCGKFPQEFAIPLAYRPPVYGRLDSKYAEYVAPGALVIILFLIPLATCGLAFVSDKRQGTMDRSMAAGVTTFEMMAAFFVTDGLAIIIQTIISTVILVHGFEFKVEGSYILYGILCFLTGLCGQSWGFVLGIMCADEASLLLMGFSLHFPLLVQGGIIWPLQGIPVWFRYFSHCLPVTASLHSMRSIVTRGVGIDNIRVWPGFLILSVWIILAWCFAVVKYKSLRR